MVYLQAMQGMGRPGVNIWAGVLGAPMNGKFFFPGYGDPVGKITGDGNPEHVAKKTAVNPVKQKLYRLLLPDSILNPPVHWVGEGFCAQSIEQQFIPYTYPMEGHPEIKLFYRYGGSFMGTMTETNRWLLAYQSRSSKRLSTSRCGWIPRRRWPISFCPPVPASNGTISPCSPRPGILQPFLFGL